MKELRLANGLVGFHFLNFNLIGDCFLYTNSSGRLQYYIGGEVVTLAHLPFPCYLLGFVPREDRLFLIDKTYNIISYKLLLNILEYQTAVVRKDFDSANSILPTIPKTELTGVARFLESQVTSFSI